MAPWATLGRARETLAIRVGHGVPVLVLSVAVLFPTTSTWLVQSTAAAADAAPEVKPAQIVILVDESGSISDEDLVREKEAAGLIAQSEFSTESRVIGFGSDEGGVGPVDAVCPPIVVAGAAERQLRRRPAHA